MKPYEFWPPRVFEAPYYGQLLTRSLLLGMKPSDIPKANYALENGEIGLGSKFSTQMAFDQTRFPCTSCEHLPVSLERATTLGERHGFPLILKPLIGVVGKGVVKIDCQKNLIDSATTLEGEYIIQSFCSEPEEFGVFFVRKAGINRITGVNKKHFPTILGDGQSSVGQLAKQHPRYTDHWSIFLRYLDLTEVVPDGEEKRLSFIGSHTLGCKFTDDSHLQSRALERTTFEFCDSQPGFNFGRLDVRTPSTSALQDGEFTVIEVNGIASLPTHMFDPQNSLKRAYQIFFEHGRHLIDIAYEHRHQEMEVDSYSHLWRRWSEVQKELEIMHGKATQSLTRSKGGSDPNSTRADYDPR